MVPPVMQQLLTCLSIRQHLSNKVLLRQHFRAKLNIEIIGDPWYYIFAEREKPNDIQGDNQNEKVHRIIAVATIAYKSLLYSE